jgi:tetratricopeptide (TPR) repeat protein
LLDRNDVAGLVAFSRTPEPLGFGGWVLIRLGTDLRDAGEYHATRDLLRAAVARYPHDVWLRSDLVYACLGTYPPALHEALHHAAAAVTLQPNSLLMYQHLGGVYLKVGDPDGSIACYREMVRLDSKHIVAHAALGVALRKKGDHGGAVAAFREAFRLTRTKPDNYNDYNYLGAYLRDAGELDVALVCFQESIKLAPTHAGANAQLCVILRNGGNLDEALAAASEFVRVAPQDGRAHAQLGWTHRARKEYDKAADCYAEVVRLMPASAQYRNEYGLILADRGDLNRAIDAYREAIRLDPKYVLTHGNLGQALLQQGDLAGAVAAYRAAIALGPNNATVRNALARVLATGPDGVRDSKQAVEHATRACELTKWKNPTFIDTLAGAYAEAGDFGKAVEYQKMAVNLATRNKQLEAELLSRIGLYERKQPYRDPTLVPRVVAPPPRPVKR